MKISDKLVADWIIENHYLGSFLSATGCYGIFRSGELADVAVLGTAQHKIRLRMCGFRFFDIQKLKKLLAFTEYD